MKRYLSLILALVMVVSLIPATVFAASGDDIVFDFTGWLDTHPETVRHTEMSASDMENIAPNKTGTAQTSGICWETNSSPKSMRLCNLNGDWETQKRTGGNGANNKVAFDITVSAEDEGWYSLEIPFAADSAAYTFSVYMVSGGNATFLGDICTTSKKTNPVYLYEGTNTLVFCSVSSLAAMYISKIVFTKLDGAPTAAVVTNAPSELGVGGKEEGLIASIKMSDGTTYQFADYIMASDFSSAGEDTGSYLKVEAENTSILDVTYTDSKGHMNKSTATYSIEALSGGTTNLVFTPVVGGVAQTSLAVKKEITVTSNELTGLALSIDDDSLAVGETASLTAKTTWSSSSDEVVSPSDVTYSASPADVVSIENGVVTAEAAGTAEITATLNADPTKKDSVSVTVTAVAEPRTYEYLTSFDGFYTDKMIQTTDYSGKPVIRTSGGKPYGMYYNDMFNWEYEVAAEYSATEPQEAFKAMDLSATDKWAYVAARQLISSMFIKPTHLWMDAPLSGMNDTASAPYVVLKVNVDAPGDYILQLKGATEGSANPAIYFFKNGTAGVTNTNQTTYPAGSKVGYFNSASTDYIGLGEVKIEESGEYIIALVCDSNSKTLNDASTQNICLSGIKLVPKSEDKITGITLASDKAKLSENESAQLSSKAVYSVTGERALRADEVELTCSPLGVVSVTADGVVTALATGTATVTATLKADRTKTSSVEITVEIDSLEGIELEADRIILYPEGEANLTVNGIWTVSPSAAIPNDKFDFNSSDNSIATVSASGVVTGVSVGTVTITATHKENTSLTDTLQITVKEMPNQRRHEYKTQLEAFNYSTLNTQSSANTGAPTLRIAGSDLVLYYQTAMDWNYTVPAEFTQDNTEVSPFMNLSATDKWALVGTEKLASSARLHKGHFFMEAEKTYFGDGADVVAAYFRVNVEAPGDYILRVKATDAKTMIPAVHFFKEGTVGVDSMNQTTYPANSLVGYFGGKSADYMGIGEVTVEEEGNYIVAFICDSESASITPQAMPSMELCGIELVPSKDNVVESFTVESSKSSLMVGKEAQLTPKLVWTVMGEEALEVSDVTYESSDNNIATVSDDGVVTGISAGTVTITAALKADTSKTNTVTINVIVPGEARIHTYVTSQAGFEADNLNSSDSGYADAPIIRTATNAIYFQGMMNWDYVVPAEYAKDGVAFTAMDTTDEDGDEKKTDPWALVAEKRGRDLGSLHLSGALLHQFRPSDYGVDDNYVVLRLNVETPGEYLIRGKADSRREGAVLASYFFKEDTAGVTASVPSTYPEESKLSYYNIPKATNYDYLGKVTIDEPGNYILAFVTDANSKTLNTAVVTAGSLSYQWFSLSRVELIPADLDFLKYLEVKAETDILYYGESLQLDIKEVWEYAQEKEIPYSDLILESSDEAIATVSEDGVVTPVSQGKVTITATKKSAPECKGEYKVEVYDPDADNIGVRYQYNIGTFSLKDQTKYNPHNSRLDEGGILRDTTYADSYEEMNEEETDLWCVNNVANVTWPVLAGTSMWLCPRPADYAKGSIFVIQTRVPVKGLYNVDIEILPEATGSLADVYVFPKGDYNVVTAADIAGMTPIGTIDAARFDKTVQRAGSFTVERGGDYIVAFKLHGDNPLLDTEARHETRISKVMFEAPRGQFEKLGINIETLDGEGEDLYLNAYRKVTFDLLDFAGNKLEGVNPDYIELNDISLTKGDGEVARLVCENGNYYVETWDAEGEAELTLDVTYRGINVVGTFAFNVADVGKRGRTIYTDEMIATARENIKKYDWARSTRDSAVKRADQYLALGVDALWDMVTSQDTLRIYNVGIYGDPDKYYCRYCRENIYVAGGGYYPFTVDPIKEPWKVKCPECSRSFPSNDFGKFYELGKTEENGGKFNRYDALEAHRAMLIEKGLMSEDVIAMTSPGEENSNEWYLYYGYGVKGGYLHNDLYPEVGSSDCPVLFDPNVEAVGRWGVDDGFGYVTGKVFPNGTEEIHTYIGYYNHFGTFFGKSKGLVDAALVQLGRAYMYTGDDKYGNAGAILLDRLADNYPDYDLRPYLPRYPNNNGGSHTGRALGKIWETYVAETLAESYDVFWPAFENPEVIEYLHNKAVYYGMENDKSTAVKIRQNIEDGICREIFRGVLDMQIQGNFGLHQMSVANAAVALDHKKDTGEMVDWLYTASVAGVGYNTGGDIERKLVETVYRDGMNWESPYYNELGISDFIDVGINLNRYKEAGGEFDRISILEHPKYLQMINSFQLMTLIRRGVKPMGDSGSAAYYNKYPAPEGLIKAYNNTKNSPVPEVREASIKMAQHLYMTQGKNLKTLRSDIWTKNPEAIYEEILDIVEEYGEYPYDKSSIMTGYGFAALRDGTLYDTVGITGVRDTTRDFTLNFSGHRGHNHGDFLDLGIEAYGIGMTTDLGYPETPNTGDPHTSQWSGTALAHNTVVVNETGHGTPNNISQVPHHFDAKDTRVKVVDASTPNAYSSTCKDNFRRTVVMIDYDDEISYGVDFFRVTGGRDHLYTFSPNSNDRPEYSDNLTFIAQIDEPQDTWVTGHENYYWTSSYAGPTVQLGQDPNTNLNNIAASLKYPRGYTWMFNVERADNPGENEFWLDYSIKDFGKEPNRNPKMDIRLRFTALNDFDADEVSLVSTQPQRKKENESVGNLEKFLIRRTGSNLDSLFTGVYEPYIAGERYITDIQSETLTVEKIAGEGEDLDYAKAVRVSLVDGRTDYIVYASNNNNTYRITDTETGYSFEFKGFIGVWTINENADNIYSYLNDGTDLGEGEKKVSGKLASVTGTVVDFQKELSLDNWVDVEFDRDLTQEEADDLVDRMMDIERDRAGNSAYMVWGVEMTGPNTARIDLDSYSTIDTYVDLFDQSKGFIYDIEEGKSFEIPMSYEMSGAPVFDAVEGKRGSVGSSITVTVNAVPVSEDLTVSYSARTLPRGAMFDAQSGTFSWKPSTTQLGKNLVAIDAVDSMGRVSTLYFEVEVYGSVSGGGGGGGGGDTPLPDKPKDEPKDEPTVEPDEPKDEPTDEPTTDEPVVDVPTEKGFRDLGNHAWAEDAINYLAEEGIIKGTSETTFAPQNNITRADYAILLVRAFELESENAENFADVSVSDYFAKELAVARNTGIVGGIGDNKYAPRKTITRQDMMVILYRALTKLEVELKAVDGIDVTTYADYADVADYARDAVKALVEAGLVNGKGDKLAGGDVTTRAEVAVLLKRVLDYIA